MLVGGTTSAAASAYVGTTRARHDNVVRIVAETRACPSDVGVG